MRSQSSPKPVRMPRSRPSSRPSSGCAASGCSASLRDHQVDPDPEPALVPRRLVGGQLHRRVPDPAAGDPGFGAAGDAFPEVLGARPVDRVGDDRERVGMDQAADQLLGPLLEQAGRASGRVGRDLASGHLRRPVVYPQVGQDLAVHHAHVPGGMPEPHPPSRRDPVQGVPVRMRADLVLVVAGAHHPAAGRRLSRPGGRPPRRGRPVTPGAGRPRSASGRTRPCGCARHETPAAGSPRAGR